MVNVLGGNVPGIANPIPFGLQPFITATSAKYTLTDINYNWAIAGIPFLSGETLRGTYFRRQLLYEFAAIRKDQFDNQQVPGEQSILGWWEKSQNEFSGGGGLQFLDTSQDPSLENHYLYSEGLDMLGTPGQVSLLPAAKTIKTGLTGPVQLRATQKGGVDGVLVLDTGGSTLQFVTAAGVATSYTMPGGLTGLANTFTDDGTNYYYADKTGIYSGAIASTSAATKIWNVPSGSGNYVIAWVKGRLVGALDNKVYELVGAGGPTLPTPNFSHFNTAWTYSAISEIPAAIIVSGSAGVASQIHKFTLDNSTGALPTLTSGITAATMPSGEVIKNMFAYIDTFVGIGTNKGFRIASTDTQGNLVYGPLIVQDPNNVGVVGIGGYDRFFFVGNQKNSLIPQPGWTNPPTASTVDMLLRVDLSTVNSSGFQPYANDLMTTGQDGTINSVANVGLSLAQAGMLAFATGTKVWVTDTANKQPSGFVVTPKIRYNTLEPKHFKQVYLRAPTLSDGGISIATTTPVQVQTQLIHYDAVTSQDIFSQPVLIAEGGDAQEWMALTLTLTRGTSSTNATPVVYGYQLRALPGVDRQLLITLPLMALDHEVDMNDNHVGYPGFALERKSALETALKSGNVVSVQDLQNNITYLGYMEEYHFEQQANPQEGESLGGYILVQMRIIQ